MRIPVPAIGAIALCGLGTCQQTAEQDVTAPDASVAAEGHFDAKGKASPKSSGPDIVTAMSTELWLDFLATRLDSRKAEGRQFTINLITPDNKEKYAIELSNSTLTNIQGFQAGKADLTLTLDRSALDLVIMGVKTFDDLLASGQAKAEGRTAIIAELRDMLDQFELGFEILPGTARRVTNDAKPAGYTMDEPALRGRNKPTTIAMR